MTNLVHLTGHVGSINKPEDNQPLKIRLATNETYKKDGQKVTVTEWHTITVFNKKRKAVYLKHITKGSLIGVTGKISSNQYEKDGQQLTNYEILADRIEFLHLKAA